MIYTSPTFMTTINSSLIQILHDHSINRNLRVVCAPDKCSCQQSHSRAFCAFCAHILVHTQQRTRSHRLVRSKSTCPHRLDPPQHTRCCTPCFVGRHSMAAMMMSAASAGQNQTLDVQHLAKEINGIWRKELRRLPLAKDLPRCCSS